MRGSVGKQPVVSAGRSEERACGRGLTVFLVGKARLGRARSLGLDSPNTVGGLQAIGVGSSCLVPGPGLI